MIIQRVGYLWTCTTRQCALVIASFLDSNFYRLGDIHFLSSLSFLSSSGHDRAACQLAVTSDVPSSHDCVHQRLQSVGRHKYDGGIFVSRYQSD